MERQRLVAIWAASIIVAPLAVAAAVVGAASLMASTAHAQVFAPRYGQVAPDAPEISPPGVPPESEDPIQEGRDGMRILGTIPVSPGTRAPVVNDDEVVGGPLAADRVAWSEAAKNAYAARQYAEARSLYRRAALAGDPEAQMMLGQMAERGQGGPKDLDEALGWYAAAANKGVKGASQKVASLTATIRRQAEQNQFAKAEPDGGAAPSSRNTPQRPRASNAPAANAGAASAARANKPPAGNTGASGDREAQPQTTRDGARDTAPQKKSAAPQRGGQKAESLPPRPAPKVTADPEPLGDVAESLPDSLEPPNLTAPERSARAADTKREAESAPPPAAAELRPKPDRPAGPQATAPEWPAPANGQAARGNATEPKQGGNAADSKQAQPAPAKAQPTQNQQAAKQQAQTQQTARGNAAEPKQSPPAPTQQAALPDAAQPPGNDDAMSEFAPAPRRTAPPLSAEAKAKLAQARALETGTGVAKNEAKAVEILRTIANQSPEAAFDLGWRAANGRGVKRDDKEAVRYYRMAADMGYPAAQNNLGGLLAEGRGIKRDEGEAVDWFRRAALQDFAPAQVNLALMYGKGRGVGQSDANAMAWYSRAAKAGYGPATASLAMMYSEGRGVPQDQKTADFLMESANGSSPASALVSVGPTTE